MDVVLDAPVPCTVRNECALFGTKTVTDIPKASQSYTDNSFSRHKSGWSKYCSGKV